MDKQDLDIRIGKWKYYRGEYEPPHIIHFTNLVHVSEHKINVTYRVLDEKDNEIKPERTVILNPETQLLSNYLTGEIEAKIINCQLKHKFKALQLTVHDYKTGKGEEAYFDPFTSEVIIVIPPQKRRGNSEIITDNLKPLKEVVIPRDYPLPAFSSGYVYEKDGKKFQIFKTGDFMFYDHEVKPTAYFIVEETTFYNLFEVTK